MKKLFFIIMIIFSCKTVDIVTTSTKEEDWSKFDKIDIQLLNYLVMEDEKFYDNAKILLADILNITSLNKNWEKKKIEYKKLLEIIKKRGYTSTDIQKNFNENIDLQVYKYKKAIEHKTSGAYNSAILLLNQILIKNRDKNIAKKIMAQIDDITKKRDIKFSFDSNSISYRSLLAILSEKTALLNSFKNESIENIFLFLKDKEKIKFSSYLDEVLDRKNFAKLIANLLSSDTELTGIKKFYLLKNSPIQDIKVTDDFFSEAVFLIENDYMELNDGVKFSPDNKITYNEIKLLIDNL